MLVALYFTIEIVVQVFSNINGDNGMRLGCIFFFLATFLLVG